MLSKWIDVSDEAMKHDMVLRGITEKSSYISGMLQQVSYVGLIGVGAYLAAEGHMTMGSLIACSILSGRAMAPVAQIPGLMVQAAHARAALKHLENVFSLERDNHEVERPIIPEKLRGHFILERVRFAYQGMQKALYIPSLLIQPGEKIGLIGPIGAGKSTLLRILTGMYRANEGRVLLDNLDIHQVSRQFLGERIAYLQQDHRLFSGTLRENLLIGIPDPGDEAIRSIAEKTGLLALISNHPKGLDLPIAEGGKGLSGGQRQLLAFTRILLSKPDIWLLDEPTASMDSATEQRCMSLLAQAIKPQDTVVLVTHKQHLLKFVNRLICIVNHQILIDGPRDEVLKKLAANIAMQSQNTAPETASPLPTGSV
jgi:ATP-binding cassette subfamily C protein LapB